MNGKNLNLYIKNAEMDLKYAVQYADKYDLREDARKKLLDALELVRNVRHFLTVAA